MINHVIEVQILDQIILSMKMVIAKLEVCLDDIDRWVSSP
jgi:hypothetical protein